MTAIEEVQQQVKGVEGSEDWEAVATEFESEDYDWNAISVFWSPSARKYFWFSDGGCSCSWHMEGPMTLGDFEVGNKADALLAAKAWSNGNAPDFVDKVRDHKGLRLN